jgi:lon-related putative ATP-dependent protease
VSSELRARCRAEELGFRTTAELAELEEVPGQERALEALDFALHMGRPGFNLFVMGSETAGHRVLAERFLASSLAAAPPVKVHDWIYLNRFDEPRCPRALALPRGAGRALRDDMDQLIEDLVSAIPAAFESEEYQSRLQQLRQRFAEEKQQPFEDLRTEAEAAGFALLKSPAGISIAPVRGGEVMDQETFEALPDEEKKGIEAKLKELEGKLEAIVQQVPQWRRNFLRELKELNREVTRNTARLLLGEVRSRHGALPGIAEFLDEVEEDVLANAHVFQAMGSQEGHLSLPFPLPIPGLALPGARPDGSAFDRYRVNLLVDNAGQDHPPLVHEMNPNHFNLLGRVEHESEMGALTTDFTLIRAGALHRANGGVLVLDARSVLLEPFAWESLKRALLSRSVRIESPAQAYALVSTVTLEPEPIPLDTKVVMVGNRLLYALLRAYDPDFSKLFKVTADYEEDMPRTTTNQHVFARHLAGFVRRRALPALDASAVALLVEQASRLAGHARKLSLELECLADLIEEAVHWAGRDGAPVVEGRHVAQAIEKHRKRHGRVRDRVLETIAEGTVLVSVSGRVTGQINGLSVLGFGDVSFGQPSRITVRVRPGGAGIVDIERKVELGGPLHSKGVLILSGFLHGHFLPEKRLSLSATIGFEQSYGGVDGDSASSAELHALLSALSGVPLRQDLAVTGSVNQHGEIQAIGGVNEKIEGFYDTCVQKGLSGDQGVVIPSSNVKHLMLRPDVVDACAAGRFHVYPVGTVDEAIELLTGVPAGSRGPDGKFPADTVFGRVEATLERYAKAGDRERDSRPEDPDEAGTPRLS